RRLLADPQLRDVGAIVLDEFHERHLPGDLALALTQRLLPRIKLVVMSATLDAATVADHLKAPVVRSEGRRFPVEIEHLAAPDAPVQDAPCASIRAMTWTPGLSTIRPRSSASIWQGRSWSCGPPASSRRISPGWTRLRPALCGQRRNCSAGSARWMQVAR